jgi:hypothetical protein
MVAPLAITSAFTEAVANKALQRTAALTFAQQCWQASMWAALTLKALLPHVSAELRSIKLHAIADITPASTHKLYCCPAHIALNSTMLAVYYIVT